MVESVHMVLNVYQLLAVLVTVPARKDTVHKQMGRVLMSMNVLKIIKFAAMEPNVSISLEATNAYVLLVMEV